MTEHHRRILLLHYCRVQMPAVTLAEPAFHRHLERTFELFQAKSPDASWPSYLDNLYSLDWFLSVACIELDRAAWEQLFAARTGRTDVLLIDALRARAARLYPRDEERQDSAIDEFWSQLLVTETGSSRPVLLRYDGQRPLVPWLIRVFQNAHISKLRSTTGTHALPDDDVSLPLPSKADPRWHELFCAAAKESFDSLSDVESLILGLRMRYRMSQREVAQLLGVHEGTVSRQTDKLRDRILGNICQSLAGQGWVGDDLTSLILTEMGPLLLEEPRFSSNRLAAMLAQRGKSLPMQIEATG